MSVRDNERTNIFTFLIYAEHFKNYDVSNKLEAHLLQQYLCDLLSSNLVGSGYISPLHYGESQDTLDNSDYFDTLHSHFHVNIKFPSVISLEKLYDKLSFLPPDSFKIDMRSWAINKSRIRSWTSAARYLIHLDQPTKQQFELGRDAVLSFGGADYYKDTISNDDIVEVITDIKKFIYENDIDDWAWFDQYCIENNYMWNKVLILNHNANKNAWNAVKGVIYRRKNKKC